MGTTKTSTPGKGNGVDAFFARCGYSPQTQNHCWLLVQRLFPNTEVEEVHPQGYCSYTLLVGHDRIIQFRPAAHKLRLTVAEAAENVYGTLAPRTQLLTIFKPPRILLSKDCQHDVHDSTSVDEGVVMEDDQDQFDVISLRRIRGISLAELRASSVSSRQNLYSVVRHFARFIATGWNHAHRASGPRASSISGRIGRSLAWRLEQMCASLPPRFAPFLSKTRSQLDKITSLPWVLTHGDIVPANIMVEPSQDKSGELVLTGILDWAEAEYLPFGVGLYGLEEILGETDSSGQFTYYSDENELRTLFWAQVDAELATDGSALSPLQREIVDDAHTLGVLLWHGIAFDNGKLDRVVEEGRDDEEISRLDLFFAGRM